MPDPASLRRAPPGSDLTAFFIPTVLPTLAAHLNRWLGRKDTIPLHPRLWSRPERGTEVVSDKVVGPRSLMNESLPPGGLGRSAY